jgi:dienelactone hydrolase
VEKFPVNGVDIEVYRTKGSVSDADLKKDKVIYHFYDIFGLRGGRSMVFADTLADIFKCEVVFIDGSVVDGKVMIMNPDEMDKVLDFLGQIPWAKMKQNYYTVMDKLEAEHDNARTIATTGTCWGALAGFHVSGADGASHPWAKNIKCGANYHPSVQVCGFEKQDPLELGKSVTCPQLLLPCKDDHEMYNKALVDVLPAGSQTHDFRDQAHGFLIRGDVSDATVSKRITEALELTIEFFKKHGFAS